MKGPAAKENNPDHTHDSTDTGNSRQRKDSTMEHDGTAEHDDSGSKRDKFATDADDKDKEDSDVDEQEKVADAVPSHESPVKGYYNSHLKNFGHTLRFLLYHFSRHHTSTTIEPFLTGLCYFPNR